MKGVNEGGGAMKDGEGERLETEGFRWWRGKAPNRFSFFLFSFQESDREERVLCV